MALYTVTEAVSGVFGGAAFDVLHLTLHQTLMVLTVLSGLVAVLWLAFAAAYAQWRGAGGGGSGSGGPAGEGSSTARPDRVLGGKGYAAVPTGEEEAQV